MKYCYGGGEFDWNSVTSRAGIGNVDNTIVLDMSRIVDISYTALLELGRGGQPADIMLCFQTSTRFSSFDSTINTLTLNHTDMKHTLVFKTHFLIPL